MHKKTNRPGFYKLASMHAIPRSIKGGKAHALAMRRQIGDELLTIPQIAKRLNVGKDTARARYKREADRPGPITWEGMKVKSYD